MRVGVIGSAGYTGGELLRILVNHPEVELVFVNSNSNAGNKIYQVHQDLVGYTEMRFTDELPFDTVDAIILCLGHGDARKFLDSHTVPSQVKIIDLSTDYRHNATADGFVYGLPELNREEIKTATKIANPGCFATSIQLGLLPLAAAGEIKDEVHISAITGSTGAGIKPGATSHFSWRNNNMSVYKAFDHQHLHEIGETMAKLQSGFDQDVMITGMAPMNKAERQAFLRKGLQPYSIAILDKETGVSPGQACVFYLKDDLGDKMLGGGWIHKTYN